MPKLRHLAIRTEDTGKLASFYMDVFEMQMLHKDKNEGGAIFLTDGYFNLAILPNHEAASAQWSLPLRLRGRERREDRRAIEEDQS